MMNHSVLNFLQYNFKNKRQIAETFTFLKTYLLFSVYLSFKVANFGVNCFIQLEKIN